MRLRRLVCIFLLAGCGYHFTPSAVPGDVQTLGVGTITNATREFGLEKSLAFALEREVVRRGTVRLADEPGAGDAVMSGAIRSFEVHPVSFNASDQALQYEATIVVELHLQRNTDGKVLWHVAALRKSEEYSAVQNVVVTSSSQFQRGTLEPIDLPKFTQIQLAESERRQAIQRLLDDIARDAYALMIEDF